MKKWLSVALMLLVLMACTVSVAEIVRQPMALEAYQTAVQNADASQAFIKFVSYENPVYQTHFDDNNADGWQYSFYLKEVNGIPFTVTLMHETFYDQEGRVISFEYFPQEEMQNWGMCLQLEDGALFEYGMRIDGRPDCRWAGYVVEGVDANGNELCFHGLIEFLPDPLPVQTADMFRLQPAEDASVWVGGVPASVKAACREDGSFWWEYTERIENRSDAPITVVSLQEVLLNGENMQSAMSLSVEALMDWCGEEDAILSPDESWNLECAMPVQELTMVGLRFTGVDENGKEISAVSYIDLLHETSER